MITKKLIKMLSSNSLRMYMSTFWKLLKLNKPKKVHCNAIKNKSKTKSEINK